MRRLFFLLLILIILFCATQKSPYYIETFDNNANDGFIYYLLKEGPDSQVQLIEGPNDTILFNSVGESLNRKLEPTDPSIYGELIIEGDKMDYNGETADISYYKRRMDYITITFTNKDDAPITFSMTNKNNVSSVLHKNSEIGTFEKRPDNNLVIKLISHPDATKYIPYIVGGYLYWKEKH